MAAIALGRQGSFSSSGGSSDYGRGALGPIPMSGGIIRGVGGGGGGGGGSGGLDGPSLTSLQYQPQQPQRRASFMRDSSLSKGLGYGYDNDPYSNSLNNLNNSSGINNNEYDDLSLLGECDLSSTRSRENTPGRRASLSAAIQLTRTPPKRNASASRPRGRRNSLFGNNSGGGGNTNTPIISGSKSADADDANTMEALAKLSIKKGGGGRRASMAGYPVGGMFDHHNNKTAEEPEPTPQFFAKSSKKSKPNRKKSNSFDRDDPRAKSIMKSSALSKIKRPGNGGGSRRASMSAVPLGGVGGAIINGGGGGHYKGSNSSIRSGSNSQSGSYSDYSDESDYNFGGTTLKEHKRHKKSMKHRITPGRSASYGMERSKEIAAADLGYGDPEEYDPKLPPPPPTKASKRAMQNRRGSTGMSFNFRSKDAAQKSLKDSMQWKHQKENKKGNSQQHKQQKQQYENPRHHHRASFVVGNYSADAVVDPLHHDEHQHHPQHGNSGAWKGDRRGSTSSSNAASVATDIASNVKRALQNPSSSLLGGNVGGDPDDPDVSLSYSTPQQQGGGRPIVPRNMLGGGRAALPKMNVGPSQYLDHSSSHAYDTDETPVQSNRRTRASLLDMQGMSNSDISASGSAGGLSTMGHASTALGPMLDNSDGSHDRRMDKNNDDEDDDGFHHDNHIPSGNRRASRGLSVLQKESHLEGGSRNSGVNRSSHRSSLMAADGSSLLGFNPYGSNLNDDDEDEEEEDLLGTQQSRQDEKKKDKNRTSEDDDDDVEKEEAKSDDKTSEHSKDGKSETEIPTKNATSVKTDSTTDETTSALEPTTISAEDTSDLLKKSKDATKKNKSGDNDSDNDSMTSESPQEKNKSGDVVDDHLEEIGATGDWSQGVSDDMIAPHTRSYRKNSLLDRYPGSDSCDDIDLGYGPTHKVLNAYDDESERKDGDPDYEFENGYNLSDLYDEDYSSFGWREHRPRAAESMELIDMKQLMSKAKSTKGLYLPTFIPAHGCTNASDFIVRCFVARLRAGMTVTKHSRSRFCKSHDRILHILPTGYHITWIPDTEEEVAAKSHKKPPTKLDLTKCLEVRHAWSRDPKSSKYTGTSTLRSKCKEGAANRSFALIYPSRTVDFTAVSVDQCKILMEGFSALCFRLQMAKLEQQAGEGDDETQHTGISGMDNDNDSTTASLTGTNMSAPWGL